MISAKDIRLQLLNLANGEGGIEDWIKSDLCNGEFSTLSKFKEIMFQNQEIEFNSAILMTPALKRVG